MNKTYLLAAIIVLLVAVIGTGAFLFLRSSKNITKPNNQTTAPSQAATNSSDLNEKPTTTKFDSIPLVVTTPPNGVVVTTSTTTVSGITTPKAEVTVNDIDLLADSKGIFNTKITLDEGDNIILLTAVDSMGNSIEQEVTVTYKSPDMTQ